MRGVAVLACLLSAAAFGYRVEVLQQSGPPAQRIDIVVLGDGYRLQDQAQLTVDATALTQALFAKQPWSSYKALFNVRVVHIVSNQNGGDYGAAGGLRDTALEAAFNCQNIDRLICLNYEKVGDILASHTPDYDLALVVVNDSKYGGSGGSIPTSSTHELAADIVIHELGHSIAGLADEYESPYPGYPSCGSECTEANASVRTTGTLKWPQWINGSTPVPTPESNAAYANEVGLFEGCRYQTSGVFRPVNTHCRMNSLLEPYCAVCTEQLVKSFWNRTPTMFDAKSPAAASLGSVCGEVTFSVLPTAVTGANYSYAWYVNNVVQTESSSAFSFAPSGAGSQTVRVVARDNTTAVRSDPNGLLQDSVSWTVSGAGASCPVGICDVSATCAADGGCDRVRKPAGSVCGAVVCSNGAKSWVGSCDGTGVCSGSAGSQSCGAYGCNDAGTDCKNGCGSSADCASGFECANGTCSLDAGVPQVINDAGFGSPDPIRLRAATAEEQPVAQTCGCNASAASSLLFVIIGVLVRRRRS